MSGRIYKDWLDAYVELRMESTEAPSHVHFWSGVSAIAGALRRRVFIDQTNFRWYPNFYIILVAPPGIISKSTTADLAIGLLKQVPGINFGPDIITWQALVQYLQDAMEMLTLWEHGELVCTPMSALTCISSELGNLLDPEDRPLIDALITLYDGRRDLRKSTKTSGNETVENCFVNIIGCTTPNWIEHYVPRPMVGGGFTSRCIWVVAEEKQRVIAYPKLHVSKDHGLRLQRLVEDLCAISNLQGEYHLTKEAIAFGEEWYARLYRERHFNPLFMADFGGGFARLQTQAHKLAIILAASAGPGHDIDARILARSIEIVERTSLEAKRVFDKIGLSDLSRYRDIIFNHIARREKVDYVELYGLVSAYLPNAEEFRDLVHSLMGEELIVRVVTPDGRSFLTLTPRGQERAKRL